MLDAMIRAFSNSMEICFDTALVTFRCGEHYKSFAPHVYVSERGGRVRVVGIETPPQGEHERVDLFAEQRSGISHAVYRECLEAFFAYGMANVPAEFAVRKPSVTIRGLRNIQAQDRGMESLIVQALVRAGAAECNLVDE